MQLVHLSYIISFSKEYQAMRKLFVLLIVTAVFAVVAVPLTSTHTAQADDPFRVAVVMPSATNDLAFSQSMYDALLFVQEEMGEDNFEFVFQDGTFVVDDAAVALREWALEGYDLIIAHGSQYGAVVEEIAIDFPDTSFAWGTDSDTFGFDNVFAYEAASDQGGFVNGYLAAQLTESGVLGVIGPIETGDAKLYVDGFVAGAVYGDEDITVNVNYIGSFSDVALAAEAAETHVANDADVLTGSAQMVVGAVGVAIDQDEQVLWFGTQANQTSLAPELVVASQVYHWEVVLMDMIELIQDGTLGGESYSLTLENEGLTIEFNEEFEVDEELLDEVDSLIEGIIAGDIPTLMEEDSE
ncbi:MAG: BMP family ABC transporter substrate-binding protein [Chloroflexi bacterium]|nr:BMP family ABC transporter substrate-binding protein [Chloroflexota bacterium]